MSKVVCFQKNLVKIDFLKYSFYEKMMNTKVVDNWILNNFYFVNFFSKCVPGSQETKEIFGKWSEMSANGSILFPLLVFQI